MHRCLQGCNVLPHDSGWQTLLLSSGVGCLPYPDACCCHGTRPATAGAQQQRLTLGCKGQVGEGAEAPKGLTQHAPPPAVVVPGHQRLPHDLRITHDAVGPGTAGSRGLSAGGAAAAAEAGRLAAYSESLLGLAWHRRAAGMQWCKLWPAAPAKMHACTASMTVQERVALPAQLTSSCSMHAGASSCAMMCPHLKYDR
jgi:hypothetical protein